MYIAKREEISRRRMQAKLNQKQLSLKAGLPNNAIWRIEKGEITYTHPIRAKAIAKALGCKINDIFTENQSKVG